MASYSLADLIGKTYTGKTDIGITRLPSDGAPVVYTVKAGQPVGIVFSYLSPKEGRSNTWLMFYDANQRAYYVELRPGQTDTKALEVQGVKTEEQKAQDALTWKEKLPKYLLIGALVIGGFYVAGKYVGRAQ